GRLGVRTVRRAEPDLLSDVARRGRCREPSGTADTGPAWWTRGRRRGATGPARLGGPTPLSPVGGGAASRAGTQSPRRTGGHWAGLVSVRSGSARRTYPAVARRGRCCEPSGTADTGPAWCPYGPARLAAPTF